MPYKDINRRREYNRKFYWRHREKMMAYQRAYNAAHKDKINALSRAYYEAHREEKLENQQRQVRVNEMYVGMCGMTRKQREKFWRELQQNSETNNSI